MSGVHSHFPRDGAGSWWGRHLQRPPDAPAVTPPPPGLRSLTDGLRGFRAVFPTAPLRPIAFFAGLRRRCRPTPHGTRKGGGSVVSVAVWPDHHSRMAPRPSMTLGSVGHSDKAKQDRGGGKRPTGSLLCFPGRRSAPRHRSIPGLPLLRSPLFMVVALNPRPFRSSPPPT